jgi:hypothetical protein
MEGQPRERDPILVFQLAKKASWTILAEKEAAIKAAWTLARLRW